MPQVDSHPVYLGNRKHVYTYVTGEDSTFKCNRSYNNMSMKNLTKMREIFMAKIPKSKKKKFVINKQYIILSSQDRKSVP